MKTKTKYPEHLTAYQTDGYKIIKNFCDSDSYQEDYKQAVNYAKKIGGVVYTMIDEENETHYLKGYHYINRIGFIVIK